MWLGERETHSCARIPANYQSPFQSLPVAPLWTSAVPCFIQTIHMNGYPPPAPLAPSPPPHGAHLEVGDDGLPPTAPASAAAATPRRRAVPACRRRAAAAAALLRHHAAGDAACRQVAAVDGGRDRPVLGRGRGRRAWWYGGWRNGTGGWDGGGVGTGSDGTGAHSNRPCEPPAQPVQRPRRALNPHAGVRRKATLRALVTTW